MIAMINLFKVFTSVGHNRTQRILRWIIFLLSLVSGILYYYEL